MNTQQHLNRLFGDKVASQVTPEVEALRSLWFVLKGHDGSLRRPGSLAGEWVGYSISVVAGAPQFRFFFKHKVPDLTPLHRVVTPFHLKTSDVFGVKFSALSRGTLD